MAVSIDQAFVKQFEREVHEAYQRQGSYQFSCWNRSDPNYKKLVAVTKANKMFVTCLEIAGRAVEGKLIDRTGGATHYHADYVSPYWAKGQKPTVTIGRHIFFKLIEA